MQSLYEQYAGTREALQREINRQNIKPFNPVVHKKTTQERNQLKLMKSLWKENQRNAV